MTKRLNRSPALPRRALCLLNAQHGQAAPANTEIEQLKQQVQLLMQNQQLNQRLNEMEKNVQTQPAAVRAIPEEEQARHRSMIEEEVARQVKEKSGGPNINEFVSSAAQSRAITRKDFAGDHSSEFVLDTVDLILTSRSPIGHRQGWSNTMSTEDNEDLHRRGPYHPGQDRGRPLLSHRRQDLRALRRLFHQHDPDPLTQSLGEINSKGDCRRGEERLHRLAVQLQRDERER